MFFSDAIQSLQAEVTTLKERLESCLRNKKPLSSVRAAPSAQDKYTPCYTSAPHIRWVFDLAGVTTQSCLCPVFVATQAQEMVCLQGEPTQLIAVRKEACREKFYFPYG